jgi:hypothetical protein
LISCLSVLFIGWCFDKAAADVVPQRPGNCLKPLMGLIWERIAILWRDSLNSRKRHLFVIASR